MHAETGATRAMPDVARDVEPSFAGALERVGMDGIDVPVRIVAGDGGIVTTPAKVAAYVSLTRGDVRGIHMSRLYRAVEHALAAEPLTPCALRRLLREFLDSHAGLSDRAFVSVAFDQLVRRPALKSDTGGWKAYPVTIAAQMDKAHLSLELACRVVYSSTCPCSAALARQLIQERFAQDFARGKALDYDAVLAWLGSEDGVCATPHSQRSVAEVKVRLAPAFGFAVVDVIDRIENALQTPVQTAVKREDEQAFALLNGENLMFCEDAARRIQAALDDDEHIIDFHIRATHEESLHPHDAVAVAVKGVDCGRLGAAYAE